MKGSSSEKRMKPEQGFDEQPLTCKFACLEFRQLATR